MTPTEYLELLTAAEELLQTNPNAAKILVVAGLAPATPDVAETIFSGVVGAAYAHFTGWPQAFCDIITNTPAATGLPVAEDLIAYVNSLVSHLGTE